MRLLVTGREHFPSHTWGERATSFEATLDHPTIWYYQEQFKARFRDLNGEAFQDFFASILEKVFPSDFIRVCPWGNEGDRKNDGLLRSGRVLFQVYAPHQLVEARAIAKIEEDFREALPHWKDHFSTWVFVHNSSPSRGLPPAITRRLLDLNGEHPDVRVRAWGFEELRSLTDHLTEPALVSLFGPSPFATGRMIQPQIEQLSKILKHLARVPVTEDEEIRPVPPNKLKFNQLSEPVRGLLQAARTRSDALRHYFQRHHDPSYRDEVAKGFRIRYEELRSESLLADEIFGQLYIYAGGQRDYLPDHQAAVYAVLAYFFEECDIFERPPEAAV